MRHLQRKRHQNGLGESCKAFCPCIHMSVRDASSESGPNGLGTQPPSQVIPHLPPKTWRNYDEAEIPLHCKQSHHLQTAWTRINDLESDFLMFWLMVEFICLMVKPAKVVNVSLSIIKPWTFHAKYQCCSPKCWSPANTMLEELMGAMLGKNAMGNGNF